MEFYNSNYKQITGFSSNNIHGVLSKKEWNPPIIKSVCNEEARPGYRTMKAHEYQDEKYVLKDKVKILAELIKCSNYPIVYTGAGISTSSGISDYATKAKKSLINKNINKNSGFDAEPSVSHHVLTQLHKKGHLSHWIQQNHDGLPQKAGFPQENLNEIHGSWYDPSNPVVPMNGSLRSDLHNWLLYWEQKTDLSIAIGTSLCGMNSDKVVTTPSKKFNSSGIGFGSVIIGLQQTQYDNICSLKIYGLIDEVMQLLAIEMNLDINIRNSYQLKIPKNNHIPKDTFIVPYDENGKFSNVNKSYLCLQNGKKVKVTNGPGKGYFGYVNDKTKEGHYEIVLPIQREHHIDKGKKMTIYILGSWWIDSAINGKVKNLPIINI